MRFRLFLGVVAFLLGFFGLVHQRLIAGMWFSWTQFWHHEPLIAIAVCVGFALIATGFVERRGIRRSR